MGGEKKKKSVAECAAHTHSDRLINSLAFSPVERNKRWCRAAPQLPRHHFLQAVRMKDRKSGRNPIRSPNAKNTFIKQSAIWREIPLEWDGRKLDGINKRKHFQEKGSCSGAADGKMRGGHVSKVCDGTL